MMRLRPMPGKDLDNIILTRFQSAFAFARR